MLRGFSIAFFMFGSRFTIAGDLSLGAAFPKISRIQPTCSMSGTCFWYPLVLKGSSDSSVVSFPSRVFQTDTSIWFQSQCWRLSCGFPIAFPHRSGGFPIWGAQDDRLVSRISPKVQRRILLRVKLRRNNGCEERNLRPWRLPPGND